MWAERSGQKNGGRKMGTGRNLRELTHLSTSIYAHLRAIRLTIADFRFSIVDRAVQNGVWSSSISSNAYLHLRASAQISEPPPHLRVSAGSTKGDESSKP